VQAREKLFLNGRVLYRRIKAFAMRRICTGGVTACPTAEWIARQLREASGWEVAPDCIVRDRDCAYGDEYVRRLRAMGIRDRPTAPRLPCQNAYAERLIGSIRREVLDHVVVVGERHLRHVLLSYMTYHNEARTHLSLDKDVAIPRQVQGVGRIFANPVSADCIITMSGSDLR
jgi:transposase InsO family protein